MVWPHFFMKGLDDFEPGGYYHVINHAVGKENLFKTEENYNHFLRRYAHYMPAVCDTICYCLMPNHIHFLIRIYDEEVLAAHPKFKGDFHRFAMQPLSNLMNSYAKGFNKRYNRRGPLWLEFTKRFKIESEEHLTAVINYIHQNPVKHHFTQNLELWPHSSYQAHLSDKATLLARKEVIDWFGGPSDFKQFHRFNSPELNPDYEFQPAVS
jgi:putative transposase